MIRPLLTRGIDLGFALISGALLLFGGFAGLQRPDLNLTVPTVVGGVLWLLLVGATASREGGAWRSWMGTLQFLTCWTLFPLLKGVRQVFLVHGADAALLAFDRHLWGGLSLPERAMRLERPWLSDLVCGCYFLFYFMVLVPSLIYAWWRRSVEARTFYSGLAAMYLIGMIGYASLPAAGPFLAFPEQFPYPPAGGAITAFLVHLVSQGITGMDVFPSLHAGIGSYVLGFLWLAGHRRLALMLAPVLAGLILATVYLRYHYGIDVICGLLLAAVVLIHVRQCLKDTRS